MVQQFKSSLKFKPKDNIVEFLNNKVSETSINNLFYSIFIKLKR